MEYPFLEIEKIKEIVGDNLLCEWQESKAELLGGLLVRPETERAKHYCGIVLKKGNLVSQEDIKEGCRVLWEQFSGFEKFQSEDGKKRYAIVKENACLAIIPHRTNVKCDDWSIYGEGDA